MRIKSVVGALIAIVMIHSNVATAQTTCTAKPAFEAADGREVATRVTRQVRRLGDALTWTAGMRVNTDGALNAYHPTRIFRAAGGPLTSLCNGFAVVTADGRRLHALNTSCQELNDYYTRVRDNDWRVPTDYSLDFFAIAHRENANGRYRLCIQESGEFAGYFLSRTSLAADPSADECAAGRYVSSTTIPFITLPSKNADFRNAGARPGDVALVHRRVGDRDLLAVAVVADFGNASELGEGSPALHALIGNAMVPGQIRGISRGVTTFLFPDRKPPSKITAEGLAALRNELVTSLGGMAVIAACSAG
jgi:hypothetical protein